jgi:hypothetical protein
MTSPVPNPDDYRRRELAHRVGILQDVYELETGEPMTFPEISDRLQMKGVSVSRARWSYITTGGSYKVTDKKLLAGIAEIFGEDPEYLLNLTTPATSKRIAAHMPAIAAKRQEHLLGVAARSLGPVAPETYRTIAKTLMEDIERLNAEARLPRTNE